MNELGIDKFSYPDSTYTRFDRKYRVAELIEAAKDLEPFDLLIKGIDLGVKPWGEQDIKDIAWHMIRINDADMSHPIILDDTGYVCDGWHRVVKAIVEGRKTIKAVRLTVMPDCIIE